uniref:ADAMTS like 1 n=1 Tax=Leptobrachium leishanense TaxID=445787 RepID=A0A8C5LWN0_9ANUR
MHPGTRTATLLLLPLACLLMSSRTARSEEDRDTLWDAWGPWSECSRTCGGGASYSLRRCLSSKSCDGRNIRYRTCSNVDCPAESGDFRAQQCSAHNDMKYQGQYREWLPIHNDPENPCSLKCQAKGTNLVVELAPKVLDGTRCYTESLDMCISGLCQAPYKESYHSQKGSPGSAGPWDRSPQEQRSKHQKKSGFTDQPLAARGINLRKCASIIYTINMQCLAQF